MGPIDSALSVALRQDPRQTPRAGLGAIWLAGNQRKCVRGAVTLDLHQGTWPAADAHDSGMRTNRQFDLLEWTTIAVLALSAATIAWILLA